MPGAQLAKGSLLNVYLCRLIKKDRDYVSLDESGTLFLTRAKTMQLWGASEVGVH